MVGRTEGKKFEDMFSRFQIYERDVTDIETDGRTTSAHRAEIPAELFNLGSRD